MKPKLPFKPSNNEVLPATFHSTPAPKLTPPRRKNTSSFASSVVSFPESNDCVSPSFNVTKFLRAKAPVIIFTVDPNSP